MRGNNSLDILIPARNEMFLAKTIENILTNMRGDTEIIVVIDGESAGPPVPEHPKVRVITLAESIGQRAATNYAAKQSTAKFIMKCDAHCAFEEGFDVTLMDTCEYSWTVMPRMRNLHAFNWRCMVCGLERYQGPAIRKCAGCANTTEYERIMIWKPRRGTVNDFMRFDSDLHFQYWRAYKTRPESQGDIVDCMSLIGACWMMHRERYWDLGGMDEQHGSWGQMGTEIACKSHLSGGRLVVNKRAWFAHLFRTQGADFGFPYPLSSRAVHKARKHSVHLWKNGNWPLAIHPLSWLVRKFAPVPGWEEKDILELEAAEVARTTSVETIGQKAAPVIKVKDLTKGMVYYTDNQLDPFIADVVRTQLLRISENKGIPIVSVSLKPIHGFGQNIVLPFERGSVAMTKQMLRGIETIDTDIVFFVEHDIIYHPCHFDRDFRCDDVFWYNENTWKVRSSDGQALFFYTRQTSGCCAFRRLLLEHYQKRVVRVEAAGKVPRDMGYEPGCHHLPKGVDNYLAKSWMSEFPNVDIRHEKNLTWSRFKPEQYRSQRSIMGWTLADEIPGWGITKGRFTEFLKGVKENAI